MTPFISLEILFILNIFLLRKKILRGSKVYRIKKGPTYYILHSRLFRGAVYYPRPRRLCYLYLVVLMVLQIYHEEQV